MKSVLKVIACASVVSIAILSHSDANAGLSNLDYYFNDLTDFVFETPGGRVGVTGPSAGQLEGDIDSTGAFAYGGSAFATGFTPIVGINAEFTVVASGTGGMLDPDYINPGSLTLRMRIRFTGGSLPVGCQTALFTVTVADNKSSSFTTQPLDHFDGSFAFTAADFVVPALTTAACGPSASTLNSTMGLGAAAGNIEMLTVGSITTPQIPLP